MGSRRPYGRHYPTWNPRAALLSSAVAKGLGISERTNRRWKQRQRLTGSLEPGPYSSARRRQLTIQQMFLVAIKKGLNKNFRLCDRD
jgi:transposase